MSSREPLWQIEPKLAISFVYFKIMRISYISKTTYIFKSIIEQKLLEIMFITLGDFNVLAKRTH